MSRITGDVARVVALTVSPLRTEMAHLFSFSLDGIASDGICVRVHEHSMEYGEALVVCTGAKSGEDTPVSALESAKKGPASKDTCTKESLEKSIHLHVPVALRKIADDTPSGNGV